MDDLIRTTIPHYSVGASKCSGLLNGVIVGDRGDIFCTECGVVVRTVRAFDLRQILGEMELQVETASAECPNCGAIHVARGASKVLRFVCENCGQPVSVPPGNSQPFPTGSPDHSDRVLEHKVGTTGPAETYTMAAASPTPQRTSAEAPPPSKRWSSGEVVTFWYALDNHQTATRQVQSYDNDAFVRRVDQAIGENGLIQKIDRATEDIDKRVSVIEQWKRDVLDPNMRKLRVDQESLKRGQDEIRRKLETDEAFVKLSDPARIINLINGEIALAIESGKKLAAPQLVDYRAAMRGIPSTSQAYWPTVAAIVNYQSKLDQIYHKAPDPTQVSGPCPFFTDSPNFSNNGIAGTITVRHCVVDLDNSNQFDAVHFIECVIRYNYRRTFSFRIATFTDCPFELGQPPPVDLPANRTNLLRAILNSPDQSNVKLGG